MELTDSAGKQDRVPVEEPLQILLDGEPLAITLRTPGEEESLVVGFLYAESVIERLADIEELTVVPCEEGSQRMGPGTVAIRLSRPVDRGALDRARRVVQATAACGACGKRSMEDLDLSAPKVMAVTPSEADRWRWVEQMSRNQALFETTGGVHAAALFDPKGTLRWLCEDIGRHNAVDKVIGRAIREEAVPLVGWTLTVSGRAGYELVQKALRAGVGCMVAVGASSSLAIDLARRGGMSLFAFAGSHRGGRGYV